MKLHIQSFGSFFNLTLLITAAFLLALQPIAQIPLTKADQASMWTGADPEYSLIAENIDYSDTYYSDQNCQKRSFTVATPDLIAGVPSAIPKQVSDCVVDTNFGFVGSSYMRLGIAGSAARFETHYRPLLTPNSSKLIVRVHSTNWGNPLGLFENPSSDFQIASYGTGFGSTPPETYYQPKVQPRLLRNPLTHETVRVNAITTSTNGKWAVAEGGQGFIRINLNTFEILPFHGTISKYGYGQDPSYDLAISDNGLHAVIAGTGNFSGFKIFDLANCDAPDPVAPLSIVQGCRQRDMAEYMKSHIPTFKGASGVQFSANGTSLSINASSTDKYHQDRVNLTAAGQNIHLMDYLALGDSFSSGEGDGDGKTYYQPGTDGSAEYPQEKCHLSSRSYPHLIAQKIGIASSQIRSVACSGAETVDIVSINDVGYRGQEDQFKALNVESRSLIQNHALESFMPGRTGQLEFVAKYKPRIVTLSIGGNDVDFADKLKSCIDVIFSTTCDFAKDPLYTGLEIVNLYDDLSATYKAIHNASPNTKIYVVGYPQFFGEDGSCGFNVRLDAAERTYISNSIKYMNDIIAASAERAGVAYVDVEDSLAGDNLCSTSTNPAFNGITKGSDIEAMGFNGIGNESYHPNEKGHAHMARSATEQYPDMMSYIKCTNGQTVCPLTFLVDNKPKIPAYFWGDKDPQATPPIYVNYDFNDSSETLVKATPDDNALFDVSIENLKPGSMAQTEIRSNPVSLGDLKVDDSGKLNATLTLPSTVPVGYHTIHVYATLRTGERADFYQTVQVLGASGDIDEDGIADDVDQCYFVSAANYDYDKDGIDDGCDGYISEPPINGPLYRVRNGIIDQSEKEEFLYFERNIATSKKELEISNDHDSNNDGWAIVGSSKSSLDSGKPAHFWIDENYIPHVSIRSNDRGCVQLTPKSLLPVVEDEERLLRIEAENSDTCRSEPADADVDNNGEPDNMQMLYRTRMGDSNNGERPDDIFIERNVVAAEAQIGVSDYDADNNGWSSIGKSVSAPTKTVLYGTKIINGTPVAIIGRSSNNCTALAPTSLEVVRINEYRTLLPFPQGAKDNEFCSQSSN